MNIPYFTSISIIISLFMNIPFCRAILNGETVNPLTTILWMTLDLIAGAIAYTEGGVWVIPISFSVGCALILACSIKMGDRIQFGRFEKMVLILIALCGIVWATSTSELAFIANLAILFIAGLPLVRDAWRNPNKTPTRLWLINVACNTCALIGAPSLSLFDIGFSSTGLILVTMISVLSMRSR